MTVVTNEGSNVTMDKIQGFIEAAMQAVTTEMVNDIAVKVVSMIEVADHIVQPETLDLMRKLPDVSKSLENTLDEVKRLEENGTLDTLFRLSEMINAMKASMTGPMITDMVEKAIGGIELADDLVQKGAINLVDGMITAFDTAQEKQKDQEPLTLFQMIRAMSDPETRKGLSLLLAFVKELPQNLK